MRILIVSAQSDFRQQMQAACLRYTKTLVSLRTAESVGQGLELAHQFEAQVVYIDLTRNIEAGILAIQQLSGVPNRMVVVSIDKLTTEFVTRTIRAGAREVLVQPVQDEDVHQILDKFAAINSNTVDVQPARNGKVVICFSSKGGVGKTTMACNLAVMLQQRFGGNRVALIDANTQAPNIAPMLDLRPTRWLRDAVMEYRRLDNEMLNELMTVHEASGLHVLAHSTDNPLGLDFSEDQLSKILLVSKGSYDWTVVDTFPLLSTLNLSMMDLSDQILLVTEPVVPSLRSARYNLEMLQKAGYGKDRIKVILNRFSNFRGNVSPELVAETLNWPVSHVVPYDVHSTIAANSGQALVNMFPDSNVTSAVSRMVDGVTGVPTPPPPPEGVVEKALRQFRNWLDL
ncbi:AAA family ATPase [Methylobacillus flagellatus]|uniref:nucleotide-binding protein n=1 Tax=Methylobacillus flagellatus TaxID=405 RepID=UPI0010F65F9B|nr:AAA family ATPase [Methylobacillus flagellatus]